MRRRLVAATAAALAVLGACSAPDSADDAGASEPAPTGEPTLELVLVTDEIAAPREVVQLDDDLLLVSDQNGYVHVVESGTLRDEPFLDVADQIMAPNSQDVELGLAGFALAPDFATSGTFYTVTTAPPGDGVDARRVDTLTAWQADPATLVADPGSARVLLEVPQDGASHVGDLLVDADGTLWMGIGSPGPTSPAQDPESLVGSLLRIVPEADGYAVPDDNPYADGGGASEVFSLGYRNPWRLSQDPELGPVLAEAMSSDAYQHVWLPEAGDNGGYPVLGRETASCWSDGGLEAACTEFDGVPMAAADLEYGPDYGEIVSGAVVLRSADYGDLAGSALVSDWNGTFLLAEPGEAPWQFSQIEQTTELPYPRWVWDLSVTSDGVAYATTTDKWLEEGELWLVTVVR